MSVSMHRLNFSVDGEIHYQAATLSAHALQYSLSGNIWYEPIGGSATVILSGNIKRVSKVNWGEIKKVSNVEGW